MQSIVYDFIYGDLETITIKSYGNKIYKVPKDIYLNSLILQPSCVDKWNHVIKLSYGAHKIHSSSDIICKNKDGSVIRSAVPMIIYFMYCAALENKLKPNVYDNYDNNVAEIHMSEFLAVIEWCDMMLKPSQDYLNFKQYVINYIKIMVSTVRSLLVTSSKLVGGYKKRLELLKPLIDAKDINIPKYIYNDWILFPAPVSNSLDVIFEELEKYKDDKLYQSRYDKNIKSVSGSSIYYCSKDILLNKKNEDIILMQDQLLYDILIREVEIKCCKDEDWFKIYRFTDECKKRIMLLMKYDELELYSKEAPKMTICDVFQFGLATALKATYE